jgi:hypothetical protein
MTPSAISSLLHDCSLDAHQQETTARFISMVQGQCRALIDTIIVVACSRGYKKEKRGERGLIEE